MAESTGKIELKSQSVEISSKFGFLFIDEHQLSVFFKLGNKSDCYFRCL